jgi:hypothetical protein
MVLLAGLCLIVFSAISISDDGVRLRAPRLRIMSHVLEKAECPLTDAQVEQIKELERGPEFREQLLAIFDTDQEAALKNARENRDRGELGNRIKGARGIKGSHAPRLRMVAQTLKKQDCPLTDIQIGQIKELGQGPGFREQFISILDADQKTALENAREKMKDARLMSGENDFRRRGKNPSRIGMMAFVLKRADCSLTEAQIEQIKGLERGPDFRDNMLAVLEPEQKSALENAPKPGIGALRRGLRIVGILENAGCPLTEEQLKLLKEIKRGTERREQVQSILTVEQKAALENIFNNDSDTPGDELEKTTAVEEQPELFNVLKQNYPNPFNPTTTIDYQIARPGNVTIEIYSPGGQLVSTLVNEYKAAGQHSVVWDASSHAAGVYIVKITSGDFSRTQKMTLLK